MLDLSISMYDLEFFLLVFTRVSAFIFVAPFFSLSGVPRQVRAGLSFFIALLLYQVLSPEEAVIYSSLMEFAIVVLKEAMVGLLIGFSASICTTIVNFGGHVADMEIGFSMVNLMDPASRTQSTVTGVFYQYVMMMMMIVTGMYRYLIGALADTFSLIPVNGAIFRGDALLDNMLVFMSDYIIIGFRIILPIFCTVLLLNAVLGVLAKVAPQMNMFAVGMQMKIIVGLCILFLTVGLMANASEIIFDEMKVMINKFAESMM